MQIVTLPPIKASTPTPTGDETPDRNGGRGRSPRGVQVEGDYGRSAGRGEDTHLGASAHGVPAATAGVGCDWCEEVAPDLQSMTFK